MVDIDRPLKEASIIKNKVEIAYFTKENQATCLRDSLFDLIIENIP